MFDESVKLHPYAKLESWPPQFRPLVERYGAARVHTKGLEVLGFPPNWSFPSGEQINALYNAFKQGD